MNDKEQAIMNAVTKQMICEACSGYGQASTPGDGGPCGNCDGTGFNIKDGSARDQLNTIQNTVHHTVSVAPMGDCTKDVPTDEEFNQFHSTPQGYGEESEWLLVSKNIPAEQALKMIQDMLRDEWGWSDGPDGEDAFPKTVEDLGTFDIGWGYDHDSYHYSEGGYWICSERNGITKKWEAWGVETQ